MEYLILIAAFYKQKINNKKYETSIKKISVNLRLVPFSTLKNKKCI